MRQLFGRLDEKRKLLGNFGKLMKISDENSIEKLNFYLIFIFIFRKFVTKLEPSEITPFFYNNFFGFGWGNFPPSPPKSAYA